MKNKYQIFERNWKSFSTKIERLSRQAVKAGNAPIVVTDLGTELIPLQDDSGKIVQVHNVEISGLEPVYNGWHFMASIVRTPDGNVVKAQRGYKVPPQYRDSNQGCDHCHTVRRRNDTYIVVHDDGTTKQVGSTCICDFLQHDGEHAVRAADACLSASDLCEAASDYHWKGGSTGHEPFRIDLDDYLAWVAMTVRVQGGYVTSKVAYERGGVSTARAAYQRMTSNWQPEQGPTAEDQAKAASAKRYICAKYGPALGFAEDMDDNALLDAALGYLRKPANYEISDFESNLLTIARADSIEPRLTGIAAYILEAYRRDLERGKQAQATQLNGAGLTRIFAMFTKAQAQLKRPAIRLADEQARVTTLSLAGAASKNAGFIYVKRGDDYCGKISPDGRFMPVGSCPQTVEAQLREFAQNPEEVAARHGKLTGCCSFCARRLTDERSTDMGYGPVCAEKYGLDWGRKAVAAVTPVAPALEPVLA